jgi:nitrate reductase beta subunit
MAVRTTRTATGGTDGPAADALLRTGYFNHRTGKAEKCTFCYPRVEVGLPTVCSETCVGRLRYIGLFLYDADRVTAAASVENEHDLYDAQLDLLLDPHDPRVMAAARHEGVSEDWIAAAQRSPAYKLAKEYRVALPLHPEFRTMPMVWCVPPLSPVVDLLTETGHDGEDAGNLFGAIDALRIPVEYLAELFTAGDVEPVRAVLQKLAAMRSYMRDVTLHRLRDESIAESVGMTGAEILEMYRLLAIAKYEERYVIPPPTRPTPITWRRSAAASTSTAGPGCWSAAARSARRPGVRRRCRSRPSTPCATGRPATRSPTPASAARGSTCSTGTARAARPGSSRPQGSAP